MTLRMTVDQFRRRAKDGGAPAGTVVRAATADPQAGAGRTVRFVFSDGSVDHARDRINPNTWDLSVFRSNPLVNWHHKTDMPPIGRAPNVTIDRARGRLVGDVEFAPPDVSKFADSIFKLVKAGFLKTGSVGFIPGRYAFSKEKGREGGIDFLEGHKLLEFSITGSPCNPNAMAEAKAMGLDVGPIREWDEEERRLRMAEAAAIAAACSTAPIPETSSRDERMAEAALIRREIDAIVKASADRDAWRSR